MPLSSRLQSLGAGAVGALTVTALNETARRVLPGAPRLDTLGRRGLARLWWLSGRRPPHGRRLQRQALLGDVVANSLYYAGVAGARPLRRGAVLGSMAGAGALGLPPWLGLGKRPTRARPRTGVLSVLWYLAGGLAAGAAYRRLAGATE